MSSKCVNCNDTAQHGDSKQRNGKRQALFTDAEARESILTFGLLKLQTMLSNIRCWVQTLQMYILSQ
jgi:hypothetical protein